MSCDGETLVAEFGVEALASWSPRFNIAPSQAVPALLRRGGRLQAGKLHWGLVPSWAKDRKNGSRLINARAETVAEKPSFRAALRKRRCLILADGYYEWAKRAEIKTPYYIFQHSRRPFAFAGLWEQWRGDGEEPYFSCSIITCAANRQLAEIHHRMPVTLPEALHAVWLDEQSDVETLGGLLKPAANGTFDSVAVSTFVNSPAHEGSDCVKPLPA